MSVNPEELVALRRQVVRLARENERQRRRLEFLVHLVAVLRSGNIDQGVRSQLVQQNRQLGIRLVVPDPADGPQEPVPVAARA